jgi:20S proteasome alpha/beta subunit
LHPADFIFAEFTKMPELLHMSIVGSPEWMGERPFVAVNGDLFAYALLRKYQKQHLKLEQTTLLAYKVLEETIEVGAYGIGGTIDLWQISAAGMKNLNAAELKTLAGKAQRLRKLEIALLLDEKYGG